MVWVMCCYRVDRHTGCSSPTVLPPTPPRSQILLEVTVIPETPPKKEPRLYKQYQVKEAGYIAGKEYMYHTLVTLPWFYYNESKIVKFIFIEYITLQGIKTKGACKVV